MPITGWYLVTLGFWSMLYDPIHFAVFVLLCCLVPVLLYTSYILHSLYLVMGEAYIDVSTAHAQYNSATCLLSCSSSCCRGGGRATATTRMRSLWTSGESLSDGNPSIGVGRKIPSDPL